MPPQGTKDTHSAEKATMLKKNFEDSYAPSDMLEKNAQKQAKFAKIFSVLHILNLTLTLAVLGCTVYFFRDVNQQLQPTELEAERQISLGSGEGESDGCCKDVRLLIEARDKSAQRIAALESHLNDVKKLVEERLRANDRPSEPTLQPMGGASAVHRVGVHSFAVSDETETDVELPAAVEGSGSGIDISEEYIFVDDYDDDPGNYPIDVLNTSDEIGSSSGHGQHHHAPKKTKCIEIARPVCPDDCYAVVENDAGCKITVCCHHK